MGCVRQDRWAGHQSSSFTAHIMPSRRWAACLKWGQSRTWRPTTSGQPGEGAAALQGCGALANCEGRELAMEWRSFDGQEACCERCASATSREPETRQQEGAARCTLAPAMLPPLLALTPGWPALTHARRLGNFCGTYARQIFDRMGKTVPKAIILCQVQYPSWATVHARTVLQMGGLGSAVLCAVSVLAQPCTAIFPQDLRTWALCLLSELCSQICRPSARGTGCWASCEPPALSPSRTSTHLPMPLLPLRSSARGTGCWTSCTTTSPASSPSRWSRSWRRTPRW